MQNSPEVIMHMRSTDHSIESLYSDVPNLRTSRFPTYRETYGVDRTRVSLTTEGLIAGLHSTQDIKDYYAPLRANNPALWVFGLRYLSKFAPEVAREVFDSQNGNLNVEEVQALDVIHFYVRLLEKIGYQKEYDNFINGLLEAVLPVGSIDMLAGQFTKPSELNIKIDLLEKSYRLLNSDSTLFKLFSAYSESPTDERLKKFSSICAHNRMRIADRFELIDFLMSKELFEEAKDQIRYIYATDPHALSEPRVIEAARKIFDISETSVFTDQDLGARLYERAIEFFSLLDSGVGLIPALREVNALDSDGKKRLSSEISIALKIDIFEYSNPANELIAWSQLVENNLASMKSITPLFNSSLDSIVGVLPQIAAKREESFVDIPEAFMRELMYAARDLYPEALLSLSKPLPLSVTDRGRERRVVLLTRHTPLDVTARELPNELRTLEDKREVLKYALSQIRMSSGINNLSLGLREGSNTLLSVLAKVDIGFVNAALYSLLAKTYFIGAGERWKFIYPVFKVVVENSSTNLFNKDTRHSYQLMAAMVSRWPQYRDRFVRHYQKITPIHQNLDKRINAILDTGSLEEIDPSLRAKVKELNLGYFSY